MCQNIATNVSGLGDVAVFVFYRFTHAPMMNKVLLVEHLQSSRHIAKPML